MLRIAVLVNTRSTRCPEDLEALVAPLRAHHTVSLVPVDHPPDFPLHIRAAAKESDWLVVGSGDGTIGRAGDALIEAGRPVGVLPLGNANDLARGLGLPLGVDAACAALLDAQEVVIDAGRVNGHVFFNAATIGVGAAISAGMDAASKRRWKRLSQIPRLLDALRNRRAFNVTVREGDRTRRLRSIHLAVANGRTHGGGIVVNDDASLDDHRLDLSSVRPRGLARLIALAPALIRGRRKQHPDLDHLRAARLRIETSRRMPIATDGDVVTHTPAEFESLRNALTVLVPRRPQESLAIESVDPSEPSA